MPSFHDCAFVLEPSEDDDIADLLEMANTQLLERRYSARRLSLIRDRYTARYSESMATRAEWLEAAVVLLVVPEIVIAFVFT